MKVTGKIAKQPVRVDLFMQMAMYMTAIGRTTKQMDLEFIPIWMELGTKGNGKKINSMGKVLRLGTMELHTKEFM